jgi:hypothetical protein
MKLSSLAFAALMVLGQIAAAEDAASGGPPSATTTLPLQVPASARNAAEAPRWDAAPASGAARSTADQFNFNPSNSLGSGSNPNASSQVNATTAPASDASSETQQPKPLQSVMKRRPAAGQNGDVVPANYNAPATPNSGVIQAAGNNVGGASAPPSGAMNSAQPAGVGSNPPGFLPAVQAGGISPAASPSPPPPANNNRLAPQVSSTPAAPPIAHENPVDPAKLAAARAAGDLLASSIDSGTAGTTPLRLIDVLTQTSETERSAAIREYWNLARCWSDYRWAVDEAKRLDVVVPARGAVDAPMLSTARAAATARINDAQLGLESAQAALMRTARLAPQAGTYFPTDAPLVGPYQTYFSVLFASRAAPGRTLQIDRCLPIRLKTINDRTAAVQSAASAVHYAEEAHARGEVDMRTVLGCHDELRQQRRAFLNAVNDYNVDIAEYASTVAGTIAPDRLVAMLIHVKPADRVSAIPGRSGTIQLPAPPNSVANGGAGSTPARPPTNGRPATTTSNDGWVPSSSHGAETGTPLSSQSSQGTVMPGSTGTQVDPFSSAPR